MYLNDNIEITNEDNMLLMARYPDNYFDLAVVDPPYGIDVTKMNMGGRKRNAEDKNKSWDTGIPDDNYFKELFRVSKNQIVWGGNYFDLPPSQYFAIWDKGETMYGRSFAECEYAWVRSGGTRIYKKNPNQLGRIHPTQKHVQLYEFIFKNYAKQDFKILDTHFGSGSIAIALNKVNLHEKMNLSLTACELDEEYFFQSVNRIKAELMVQCLF